MPITRSLASLGALLLLAAPVLAADADVNHPAYRGTPSAAGGTCCATLGEVRSNIDRIDKAIVALIAERGSFVREAARFKPNPAAVEDKRRVEQIIAKMRGLAEVDHVSPEVVEATYRAMIAAFTEEERKLAQ
ncbi:MAG TPA: chorismate mutase [Stellaceae bacterium]|nr:chorismate mutase [Stellaceae bacterium]